MNDPHAPVRSLSVLMVGLEWFSDNPGGGGRYLADVARGLAARGHSVTVLVPRQKPELPEKEAIDGVWIHRFPLGGLNKLKAPYDAVPVLLRAHGPFDVVHSHFALYGLGPLWHPALGSSRRVCQFQGPWAAESAEEGASKRSRWAKYVLEKLAYARCGRFIVLSQAFRGLLASDYQIRDSRIEVIPAAVDCDRFAPNASPEAARRALGLGVGPVLFAMRRLVRRMGLDVLLDAFARVNEKLPEARLLIGGDGPLKEELIARAQALGLASAVSFLGRLSDETLVKCYQAADLTVVPTVALEGFGLVTVESLACGTPVVGTDCGGTAEILAPFSPGLLVRPGDATALGDRLLTLLKGEAILPTPEACRQYALSHYAWSPVLDRVEAVLAYETR